VQSLHYRAQLAGRTVNTVDDWPTRNTNPSYDARRLTTQRSSLPRCEVSARLQSQLNPVFTLQTIHFNPSTPRSSKWSLPFRFSYEHSVCISQPSRACYLPRTPHIPLDLIILTISVNKYSHETPIMYFLTLSLPTHLVHIHTPLYRQLTVVLQYDSNFCTHTSIFPV
jgi:hypothetical protein